MNTTFAARISEAEEARAALSEHERLSRLAAGLEGLKEEKRKADELAALWEKLDAAQVEMRGYLSESAELIPAWRARFSEAHAALLTVAHEIDAVQAPVALAGDALRRAYRLERKIQELEGRQTGSTVQKMWAVAGGNDADLDPLRGLKDPGLAAWFRGLGHKFLYRPARGAAHFFQS